MCLIGVSEIECPQMAVGWSSVIGEYMCSFQSHDPVKIGTNVEDKSALIKHLHLEIVEEKLVYVTAGKEIENQNEQTASKGYSRFNCSAKTIFWLAAPLDS